MSGLIIDISCQHCAVNQW